MAALTGVMKSNNRTEKAKHDQRDFSNRPATLATGNWSRYAGALQIRLLLFTEEIEDVTLLLQDGTRTVRN